MPDSPDFKNVGRASSLSKHKTSSTSSNSLSSSPPAATPSNSANSGITHPTEPPTITGQAGQPANLKFIDPWKSSILNMQKRHLPHLSAIEATYFVTFRCQLGLNIPENARHEVLSAILFWNGKRIDLDAAVVMPDHVHIIFRLMPEADGGKEEEVLCFDKLEARPTKDKEFDKLEACPTLSGIIHSIKSFSSNRINKILGRKGAFWLHENFDHIIRNETDWREKVLYIIENPLKKELVDRPEFYEWLWVRNDIDLSCKVTDSKDRGTNSIDNE